MAHHLALIDVLTDESALASEQGVVDAHDEVMELEVCIHHLITACSSFSGSNSRKIASKKLTRQALQRLITPCLVIPTSARYANTKSRSQTSNPSSRRYAVLCCLWIWKRRISSASCSRRWSAVFSTSLKIERLLQSQTASAVEIQGIKLPKLEIPTFDGDILNWRTFWEQFRVSVHDRSNLSYSEKLVGGSAKQTTEGLSRSGEFYAETVECLKSR